MATALQLTPKEWQSYHPTVASEKGSNPASHSREIKQLLDRTRKLGQRVKEDFGAKRVLLFGSLARQADFQPDSDIDLAVEGLHGSQYWEVWRVAEEYFPERQVEVVEIETASQTMRQMIEKYGIDL